jgi:hypothetical protein
LLHVKVPQEIDVAVPLDDGVIVIVDVFIEEKSPFTPNEAMEEVK